MACGRSSNDSGKACRQEQRQDSGSDCCCSNRSHTLWQSLRLKSLALTGPCLTLTVKTFCLLLLDDNDASGSVHPGTAMVRTSLVFVQFVTCHTQPQVRTLTVRTAGPVHACAIDDRAGANISAYVACMHEA